MALVLEQLLTPAMGDASYLIGDDTAGLAAVIDPQIDIEVYLAAARRHGLSIRHVLQTHLHEDFVSGAAALAAACHSEDPGVGAREDPGYGFPHRQLKDGTVLELGSVRLTVRETPGHTPEHIAFAAAKGDQPDAPFAVFSGGSLLAGTAGRTDLLGQDRVEELTRAQFDSLRKVFLALDDGVLVYPTHVHGSPCGAAIGDRVATTVGYERRHNPLLQHADFESFRAAMADLPPKPTYYERLKQANARGEKNSPRTQGISALRPKAFEAAAAMQDHLLLDTRHLLAFGGAHIPGALNIGARGHFAIQAGWMLDPARPLLLVLESDEHLAAVVTDLARTGLRRIAGYLAGGMTAWEDSGRPLQSVAQLHVRELARRLDKRPADTLALDVRAPQEWSKGHVPGARHVFLPHLRDQLASLPRDRLLAVYCDSGYRASIAASLLQARGFEVANVPGSWQAWSACGLPVQRGDA